MQSATSNSVEWSASQAPARTATICVRQGRDLKPTDLNGLADPYCKIVVHGPESRSKKVQHKTTVRPETLSPTWAESFEVPLEEHDPYIVIEVWDRDQFNQDDFMGRIMLPVRLLSDTPTLNWYPLCRATPKDIVKGEIELEISINPPIDTFEQSSLHAELFEMCRYKGLNVMVLCHDLSDHARSNTSTLDGRVFTPSLSPRSQNAITRAVFEIPGPAETIELAVPDVLIDVGGARTAGRVFLTNFRLVLVSERDAAAAAQLSSQATGPSRQPAGNTSTNPPTSSASDAAGPPFTAASTGDLLGVGRSPSLRQSPSIGSLAARQYYSQGPSGLQLLSAGVLALEGGDFSMSIPFGVITEVSKGNPEQVRRQQTAGTVDGFKIDAKSLTIRCSDFRNIRIICHSDASILNFNALKRRLQHHHANAADHPVAYDFVKAYPTLTRGWMYRPSTDSVSARSATLQQQPSAGATPSPQSADPASTSAAAPSADAGGTAQAPSNADGESSKLMYSLSINDLDLVGSEPDLVFQSPTPSPHPSQQADALVPLPAISERRKAQLILDMPNAALPPQTLNAATRPQLSLVQQPATSASPAPRQEIWPEPIAQAVIPARVQSPPSGETPGSRTPVEFTPFVPVRSFDMSSEMRRQGVLPDKWKLSTINDLYKLCSSYPDEFFVPAEIDDDILIESAAFRSRGRLPVLTWYNARKGNVIVRSAQPLVGATNKYSTADERLIETIRCLGSPQKHLVIFDARSIMAAGGNKLKGKGTEDTAGRYTNCKILFLDIGNIHAMRDSFDALAAMCESAPDASWLSALESTQWLSHLRSLLSAAVTISRYVDDRGMSVLVHCSDGWDRTAQLTTLAQLLLDPFYRTFLGFPVLIMKDWLAFGHKFRERLGTHDSPNERSPIFLQFLDCVWQIQQQFPSAFEFSGEYLRRIAEHHNSKWFGTFLHSTDKDRRLNQAATSTVSIWAYLDASRTELRNPHYECTNQVLCPKTSVKSLRLWSQYFLRFDELSRLAKDVPEDDDVTDSGSIIPGQGTTSQVGPSATPTVVMWVPDHRVKACHDCQLRFSQLRRKHHCRGCGQIFCSECVKQKLHLPQLGYTAEEKVCETCFAKYNPQPNVVAPSQPVPKSLEVRPTHLFDT
ncbi:myotubularin [Capsaspora owczarzaki ATCC 30864]|uniref:myotubularin n=1 Tax=Capsaspora owczarzaki (strain ATCC 30864) TaxID=595528 RepID=UPI0003521D44|nr:myotubularin [Capsaspora owczarzaki ATCC 30864]|eukprot:XP_004365574.2 myotubularin [Capsaspora owczarzaki ATCC 30864]